MDPLSKNLFSVFESVDKDEGSTEEQKDCPKKEPMKVVLRVKPFTQKDKDSKEDRGCIVLKENGKVEFRAPQDSFQFKSSIRGVADQTHEFSFSKVFNDTTKQKELFDDIMLPFVKDILDGQNGLVFTYGVTNSGKTYTIQGTPKDGGILPRSLDVIFNSISNKLYKRPNLKPKHCRDVLALSAAEEAQENLIRKAIFSACDKENVDLSIFKTLNSTTKSNASTNSTNSTFLSNISVISSSKGSLIQDDGEIAEEIKSRIADQTSICVDRQGNVCFGMWVSFMEIYNELIYDLLDLSPIGKGRKRTTLKLGDDKNGKPYVKGLREIFVTSADEAYKVLRIGQKNRHMASTKLNQQSSRSHCIFNIKLLKIVDVGQPHVARISRLSIVDLAGSERYCKTGAEGDLLRQAGNINASIMTLGKCISTLRYNQDHPNHQTIIPFRESKLTRLFQNFFLGKGKAAMIVNISQCASVFDETYHVLKFSAVAKQIKMKAERATEFWRAPPLSRVPATPVTGKIPPVTFVTPATSKKRTLQNPSDFTYNELVSIVGELRDKVKKERKEKSDMEQNIRKEVSQEMNELMVEIEQSHNSELMEQKHNLEDLMEKRIELLTKAMNKRKKRKMDDDCSLGDDSQVSFALFEAEKSKVKDRDDLILTLQSKVSELQAESDFIEKSRSPEDRSKQLEVFASDLKQAKETLSMQNEAMERMQNMLQCKDDEIDKLREALEDDDDSTAATSSTLVTELQQLLENTTKELDNARVKLDNRDIRIKELENITSQQKGDNEELTKIASQQETWLKIEQEKYSGLVQEKKKYQSELSVKDEQTKKFKVELGEKSQKLTEVDELCKTLQFENDEITIKLEKYEKSFKEHQNVLSENETFIEQLNKEVADLKEQLKVYEQEKIKREDRGEVTKENLKGDSEKVKSDLEKAEIKIHESNEKIERLEKQMQCYESMAERGQVNKLKQQGDTPSTPEKSGVLGFNRPHLTPVKKLTSTPSRSPYSPAKASSQQLVKKLEKMLEEKSKELDKKSSILVQKSNRVQHLEQQLATFEKKNAIKEMRAEKDSLKCDVDSLREELATSKQAQAELNFKLVNQEENCTTLESELTDITKNYNDVRTEFENLQNLFTCDKKKYEEDLRHHNLVLRQAEETHKKARDKNEELVSKLSEYDQNCKELRTSVEILKCNENDNKRKIQELEEKVAISNSKMEDAIKKLEEVESTLESLNKEKERTAESSKKLVKQLEDRRKSRMYVDDRLASTVDGYEERVKALHDNVNDLFEENATLKSQIEALKEQEKRLIEENKKQDELKLSEEKLLQRMSVLESNCNKFEVEAQRLSSIKTKLDMKINALENDASQTANKLSVHESEATELREQVKQFSEKLTQKSKEALGLAQEKEKIHTKNENNFKKILCLEKQKVESEAIISSLQVDEADASDRKTEIKLLKKKITELQNDGNVKMNEIQKHKTEYQMLEESLATFENTKKENIELKETLALKEDELKRTTEEKKFALDELLKQTVKSKRKIDMPGSYSDSDRTTSASLEPDYKTPIQSKRRKKLEHVSSSRVTRNAKKRQESTEEEVDKTEDPPLQQLKVTSNEPRGETETTVTDEEDRLDAHGQEYFFAVSVALSPIAFDQEEEKEEEEQVCDSDDLMTDYVETAVGNYVAVKEHDGCTDSIPIIGRVLNIDNSMHRVTLELMDGGYNKVWKPFAEPVIEMFDRALIIVGDISFTPSNRLPTETKRNLHKLYLD